MPRRALVLSLVLAAACRGEPARAPASTGTVGSVTFHRVDLAPHGMAGQLRWLLSPDSSALLATEDWVSAEAEPFYDGFRIASERTGRVSGRDSVWDVAPSPDWSRVAYGEALIVHAGESDTLPTARLADAAARLGISLDEARASQFVASGMVAAAGFARLGVLELDDGTSRTLPSLTGWRVRWNSAGTRIAGGLGPALANDDAPSAAWVWMTPAGDSSVQATGAPMDTATVRWQTGPTLDVSVTPDTGAVTLIRLSRAITSRNDTIRVNDIPIGPGTALAATRAGCFILALSRDASAGRYDPAWRAGHLRHRLPTCCGQHAMSTVERIAVEIIDDPDALARAVAGRIAELIVARDRQGRQTVLGLATGSTPVGVYRELIRLHRTEGLSFQNVWTFNLDEYYPMRPDSIHSYHRFMWENFFSHVDLVPERVFIPRGALPRERVEAACAEYEAAIRAAGGIDFQILGIGKTGHIGFNEPGSDIESRTRLVTLDTITRKDAAADFFGEDNVPREAITMGVATILEAREIAILATGEHKAAIVRRTVEGEIDRQVAATYLQRHAATTFYVDQAAAADLTGVATPWLLHEVEWTPALTVRAVVWLARLTGKAILKLAPGDYAGHHLASLLNAHDSAGTINGLAFNALGAKIRGRSKLPGGKSIVCFSPHPDDDVISMGGMLRKLVLNGNRIAVAYQTSGNIAVFDHDVRRYVDFLERLAGTGLIEDSRVTALAATVREFLATKQPGDVDIREVLDIKRMIRESEAVSGIETLGLSREDAHFLNLPFYQTGKVRKDPIGPADVAIVRRLLEEAKPDLIFAAGDLSDPHGTHRMCLEAVTRALDQLHPRGSDARPPVWLYRGAWQEWSVTDATWLVTMSQEELRLKIQAIFKHQSQKDSAPFPGGYDEREFWQRVEARNKETAALLDRLGLAEYFAMEAYVVR